MTHDKEFGYSLAPTLAPTDYRLEKFARQRAERGFDDTETWSLVTTIAAFTLPRLKRFREVNDGHPSDITAEEWNRELDEMIWALEQLLDDDKWPFVDDAPRLLKALELFGRRLVHLWW